MVDLIDELRALSLPFPAVKSLLAMGVPSDVVSALHMAGDLAVADVDLHRGGLFSFGGPDRRLILAVRDVHGEVVDLVALASGLKQPSGDRPARFACEDEWALRFGVADFLGEEAVYDCTLAERRELRLFSTPLAWLRGGCAGICVLDWTPAALGALRGLGSRVTIACDPGAKPKLEAMLAHGGLPLVAEVQPIRRAA